ncbi:unnamed protein product [Polarella glacialis]|uniref:C3H1-type domain-containing protein n=1 Tax=Polarella glacialis TaxID=89957 RepID=A0A813J3C3_POLGL|nr:unnamed protein product [Polarella glacialis]CAE8661470.1 unnamed protein product [Polarella glacialis]
MQAEQTPAQGDRSRSPRSRGRSAEQPVSVISSEAASGPRGADQGDVRNAVEVEQRVEGGAVKEGRGDASDNGKADLHKKEDEKADSVEVAKKGLENTLGSADAGNLASSGAEELAPRSPGSRPVRGQELMEPAWKQRLRESGGCGADICTPASSSSPARTGKVAPASGEALSSTGAETGISFGPAASVPPASGPRMPPPPSMQLPGITKVIVTVPIKLRVSSKATLGEVRRKLLGAGCRVAEGQGKFHCQGDPEAADESKPVAELSDARLVFFPEQDLEPWQLCAAQRALQQMVLGNAPSSPFAGRGTFSMETVSRQPLYKTRHCNAWMQTGFCTRGAGCVYAHGQAELRMRPQVPLAAARLLGMIGMRPTLPPPPPLAPAKKVPEVVFTVSTAEEKRRAERAKRFAPRVASFEVEKEADTPAPKEADTSAPPASEPGPEADGPEAMEVDDFVDHSAFNEEQIADYLLEMQQQVLSSLMPPGMESYGGDFEFYSPDLDGENHPAVQTSADEAAAPGGSETDGPGTVVSAS